jgi:alkaline phosphatase D
MDPIGREREAAARINRRTFLIATGALAGLTVVSHASDVSGASPRFGADPFSLGVASGDPTPDGVVLWTRLAPDPLNGGGMPARPVPVRWQIATDERMC